MVIGEMITERSLYMFLFYFPFLVIPFIYSNYREIGFKEINLKLLFKDILYFVLGFVLIIITLSLINLIFIKTGLIKDDTHKVTEIIQKQSFGDLIIMCYLAGIVEEIFFRGFLQNRIGLIPSSVLFTYLHLGYGSIVEVIGVFVISIILGLIYEFSGKRIYPVILIHFFFDLFSVIF